MTNEYELIAEMRDVSGTTGSRRLRRERKVPAIVYGGGKKPAEIVLDHDVIMHQLENEAFCSHILNVKLGRKAEKVVLKDVQRHPSKPRILHLDLLRVSAKEKLSVRVPLHFVGEDVAPGVSEEGGVVSHHMADLEVSCLPADLPEFIEVDISKLAVGGAVYPADIPCPKGVEIVGLGQANENVQPVVSIHMPRGTGEVAAEEAAETEETAAE